MNFERYLLSEADRLRLENEFTIIAEDVEITLNDRAFAKSLPATPGCYFWLVESDSSEIKLYIGRTTSLRKRIMDYSIEFQVGSPNDHKVKLVMEALKISRGDVRLKLYFRALKSGEEAKCEETRLVRDLRPLVNSLPPPLAEERAAVLAAYRMYYNSVLARALRVEA